MIFSMIESTGSKILSGHRQPRARVLSVSKLPILGISEEVSQLLWLPSTVPIWRFSGSVNLRSAVSASHQAQFCADFQPKINSL
jgi:hypothetical protein